MSQTRERARQLRKNLTDAERLLWRKLRFWQVDGLKFRRQQPLGRYIVDFICLEKKLIIEIDGEYHNVEEQKTFDEAREKWLSATLPIRSIGKMLPIPLSITLTRTTGRGQI